MKRCSKDTENLLSGKDLQEHVFTTFQAQQKNRQLSTYQARKSTNVIFRNLRDLKTSSMFPLRSTCSHFSSKALFFISSNNFRGKVSLLNLMARLMISSASLKFF